SIIVDEPRSLRRVSTCFPGIEDDRQRRVVLYVTDPEALDDDGAPGSRGEVHQTDLPIRGVSLFGEGERLAIVGEGGLLVAAASRLGDLANQAVFFGGDVEFEDVRTAQVIQNIGV